MSVKSAPRMENIPPVYCPQHSCGHFDGAQSIHHEVKDFTKKGIGHSISSKLCIDEKEEFTDLLNNVQGVRKKKYESLEAPGKRKTAYFGSFSAYNVSSVRPSLSDCLEYLDTISIDKKGNNKSKNLGLYDSFGNSKSPPAHNDPSNVVHTGKPRFQAPAAHSEAPDIHIYSSQMNSKELETDERKSRGSVSKKCGSDAKIVDDRMQITCGISGKHHCSFEYEEETDNLGTEKPPRRWLGHGRTSDTAEEGEQEKSPGRKLKESDSEAKEKACSLKTVKRSNECTKWIAPHLPVKKKSLTEKKQPGQVECLPENVIDIDNEATKEDGWSDPAAEEGAAAGRKSEEECESDEEWDSSPNPFMAAILRTTKKYRKAEEAGEGTDKACDNSQTNLCNRELVKNEKFNNSDNTVDKKIDNDIFLHKLMKEFTKEDMRDTETKVAVPREDGARNFAVPMETCQSTPVVLRKNSQSIDLRLGQKLSAVRNLSTFGTGDSPPEMCGPSEFITKSLTRLKSLFDKREVSKSVEFINFIKSGSDYENLVKNLNYPPSLVKSSPIHATGREEKNFSDLRRRVHKLMVCVVLQENNEKSGREGFKDFDTEDCVSSNANNTKTIPVPSAQEKLKFRRSLDSAAQLVFHRCSGLPLTSSPAPVRRNNNSFTFDSSLNSVSAIKRYAMPVSFGLLFHATVFLIIDVCCSSALCSIPPIPSVRRTRTNPKAVSEVPLVPVHGLLDPNQ